MKNETELRHRYFASRKVMTQNANRRAQGAIANQMSTVIVSLHMPRSHHQKINHTTLCALVISLLSPSFVKIFQLLGPILLQKPAERGGPLAPHLIRTALKKGTSSLRSEVKKHYVVDFDN